MMVKLQEKQKVPRRELLLYLPAPAPLQLIALQTCRKRKCNTCTS